MPNDAQVRAAALLAKTDDKDAVRNHAAKAYTIDMKGGQTYQIDMVSKKLDSYLRLEDAAGKELAHDDDGGGFPNARIVFNCPKDGTYRVICTTFNGGAGPFLLGIQEK